MLVARWRPICPRPASYCRTSHLPHQARDSEFYWLVHVFFPERVRECVTGAESDCRSLVCEHNISILLLTALQLKSVATQMALYLSSRETIGILLKPIRVRCNTERDIE